MGDTVSTRRVLEEGVARIRRFTSTQIQGMAQLATDRARHACLHAIAHCATTRIDALEEIVDAGDTSPLQQIRLGAAHPLAEPCTTPLRIGVYALAANPLHWGHILVGLSALVLMKLDRVVFVIAGADPRKPSLLPADTRHRLARTIIETFEPFFAYSPIALGTQQDGETNLGRLFALNPGLPIHAYYIAGSDHYRRRNEAGGPDTIEKLEGVAHRIHQQDDESRGVSAVFVERPGYQGSRDQVATSLDVRFLPAVPVICSSTAARHALCSGEFSDALAFVPYVTFAEIQSLGLYDGARECQEDPLTAPVA